MRHAKSLPLGAAAVLLAALGAAAAPKDKSKRGDLIWTHPSYAESNLQGIALLPASSFENNHSNEKIVEGLFGQALRSTGYRWLGPIVAKEMIKSALGESTLVALDRDVLHQGRVDSSMATRLCRALRTGAVLSMRIDLFEQLQVEWNQAGKPSTTVQLRSALVDSAGRLLWSASGSETGEGPYHDPSAGTVGVKGSGLGTQPLTGQAGAPSYEEVTTRLCARWIQHFPAKPTASPSPSPASQP